MKVTYAPPQALIESPKDVVKEVLISVLLDKSGSMSSSRLETISGYNHYINELRKDKETEYSVTHIQFDHHEGPELTILYEDKPLAQVPELTADNYVPRGGTPLLDAIGESIRRTDAAAGKKAVIMLIITDGQENQSREFTQAQIRKLVEDRQKAGWTFVFLGANIDSFATSSAFGMSAGNTANYSTARSGNLYAAMAKSTMTRASSLRSVGLCATMEQSFIDDAQRADLLDENDPAHRNGKKGR